jgi:hypothetical protein
LLLLLLLLLLSLPLLLLLSLLLQRLLQGLSAAKLEGAADHVCKPYRIQPVSLAHACCRQLQGQQARGKRRHSTAWHSMC